MEHTKIRNIIMKIIALTITILTILVIFPPIIEYVQADTETQSTLSGKKGQLVGNYRITTFCENCNDGGTATSSGRTATEHRTAAINKLGDPNGLQVDDYIVVFGEVWQIDDTGSGPGGGDNPGLAFIDLYVPQSECETCGGKYPYSEEYDVEVYKAEDVKEGSGVEESSGESDEPVIDVSQAVQVKGDAVNGYYLEFVDDIDYKLGVIYNQNKENFEDLGVTIEDLKEIIKAELATEYPDFGGVVESSAPVSNGTEAQAGGNEKTEQKVSSSGGGTFEWPVKKHKTPAERGEAVTSIKADRESPGGIGSKDHQGMDIAANYNDEIVATAAGTITLAGPDGGYGNAVVMELDGLINGKKATVTYGHNTSVAVNKGDHVTAGQLIAYAGSTGWSTGPHCHFQVDLDGEDDAIDPRHLFTPEQLNSQTSNADNNVPPYGPIVGDGLYCNGNLTSTSALDNGTAKTMSADGDIVKAAKKVHAIIENGYTYGPNPSLTVEESEQNRRKTVNCTTYVDWVLNEIGLDVESRYAEQMKEEFEAADWAKRVSQEEVQAGDIVLFNGHAQIYGGKTASGEDTWYNAGSFAVIRAPAPSSGLSSSWSRGPIGIYRIIGATNSGETNNVKSATGVPGSGWVELTGSSDNQHAEITIKENKNIKEDTKNRFQGSVKIRRLKPKKTIGKFNQGEDKKKTDEEIYNNVPEIPGMGKAISLSELMKGSLNTSAINNVDNLAFLTIPYYDFDLKLHEGHMIVNKDLVSDVLNIFYELYDKKYPMESIEIADNFLSNFDSDKFYDNAEKEKENQKKDGENGLKTEDEKGKPSIDRSKIKTTTNRSELGQMSADSNNTCCLYYDNVNGAAHLTGNAIDINPRYNPKTTNDKTSTNTYNAQYYVDRENREAWSSDAEKAFIDEESEVYKIFTSYGWTWGGTEGDYGHFEKTEISKEEEKTEEDVYIDSIYYDLSYVDEATFNSYIKTGDMRALYVYTLNSTRDVITGTWAYDGSKREKKLTISKVPVGFRKAINKYTMPTEFLLAILEHSKDVNFTKGLAKLGIKSKYVVTIKDNVTTSNITVNTTRSEVLYDAEGNPTGETTDPETETINYITEKATQEPEVTYVENWFVRYVNKFPGATEGIIAYDADIGGGIDISVLGKQTTTPSSSTTSGSYDQKLEEFRPLEDSIDKLLQNNNLNTQQQQNQQTIKPADSTNSSNSSEIKKDFNPLGDQIDDILDKNDDPLDLTSRGTTIIRKPAEYKTSTEPQTTETQTQTTEATNQKAETKSTKKIDFSNEDDPNFIGPRTPANIRRKNQMDGNPSKTVNTISTTETEEQTYNYAESTGIAYEHAELFETLYKNSGMRSTSNIFDSWIKNTLENNIKTANLAEVMQYLLSKVRPEYYSMANISFADIYKPDEFGFASGNDASGTLKLEGGNTEEKVWNALKAAGYSDVATVAAMGNIWWESGGFNPAMVEGGSGIGYGLCQWSFDRRTQLEAFAQSRGKPASDEDIQIEFLLAELQEKGGADGFATYQFAGHESERTTWMTSNDIEEATIAFGRGFERPNESLAHYGERVAQAKLYFEHFAGQKK